MAKSDPTCSDTICYKFGKFYGDHLITSLLVTFCILVLCTTVVLNSLIAITVSITVYIKWWWLLICYLVYVGLKLIETTVFYSVLGKNMAFKTVVIMYCITWSIENIILTSLFYGLKDRLVIIDNGLGWMLLPVACFGFTSWFLLLYQLIVSKLYVDGKCCDCINGLFYCFEQCLIIPIRACKNDCCCCSNNV